MIDADTLALLNQQDWEDLLPKLYAYAIQRLTRGNWRKADAILPKGYEIKDFVHKAIELVYDGRRVWDHRRVPNFYFFITEGVIKSLISNLFASADSRLVQRTILETWDEEEVETPLENLIAEPTSLEETLYEKELLEKAEKCINAQNDDTLTLAFWAMLEGKKNQAIAQECGITVKEAENVVRRIRRLLKPLTKNL